MTDDDALLRSVLAHPEDDLPRLVYADYLEETGDAVQIKRAEFIRVQCELARIEPAHTGPVAESSLALRTRERILQSEYREAWLAPLRRRGEPLFSPSCHGHFRRGFVEIVWMPARQFLWKSELLFDRAPVRELRVTLTTVDEVAELINGPQVARLEALDLSDHKLGDRAAFEAVRSPSLRNLHHLRLKACGLTDVAAVDLAESTLARSLHSLDLQWNQFSETGKKILRAAFADRVALDG